jgi:hypothetical protein
MMKLAPSFVIAAALSAFVVGCNSTTSPSATVSALTVSGSVPTVGSTSQFTATATMSDGTTKDVTSLATWQSSNTGDATVSAAGVVAGVADGAVSITASYQNALGSAAIIITG